MSDNDELLIALKTAVAEQVAPEPALRAQLARIEDPLLVQRTGKILAGLGSGPVTGVGPSSAANATASSGELRPLTVGVAATCTIGGYPDMLRSRLTGAGFLADLACAPYGSFELSLTAPEAAGIAGSEILTCLLDDSYFLPPDWSPLDLQGLDKHLQQRCDELAGLVSGFVEQGGASVVLHTVPLPFAVRNSVISWRARAALGQMWHQLNSRILGLAEAHRQVAVIDLVSVLADLGVASRDNRMHRYADMPYAPGVLSALADEVRRFAQARCGLSRKVLALDLDNTLWGGVLGEDGIAGLAVAGLYPANCYHQLQHAAARLREQGVILALMSKNDAEPVAQALSEHPDVVLRPEAFSALGVNWEPKAANLRAATQTLGLDTKSFVFMDDSPFEREHVAGELPELAIVAADGDPAELVDSLLRGGWFDLVDLTDTDRSRPQLYRERAERSAFASGFGSSEAYLQALGLELTARPATEFSIGRIAQLAGRTNQFNLTGVRYDEGTTAAQSRDPAWLVASFAVTDRFGDEGIVGAAWIRREFEVWRVTNLVLSCRVLGRGVELAIASWIAGQARAAGAARVEASFVPSKRNGVASTFWRRAGFAAVADDSYVLVLAEQDCPTPNWITIISSEVTP